MNTNKFKVTGEKKIELKDYQSKIKAPAAERVTAQLAGNLGAISALQDKLYADRKEGLIIIIQGMDASGKDGIVRHVMSGVNPQGVNVYSFKQPSQQDLMHDYLWRITPCIPERGKIAIFNRSYYEDVLIVKVRELYKKFNMPKRCNQEEVVEKRYEQIVNFEQYLWDNGIRVVKIFLHLSKDEQKKRLLERIDDEAKNWKFSKSDIEERAFFEDYQDAYEKAINATASKRAPWYIIPADKKPVARLAVSEIVMQTLIDMKPSYPDLPLEIKECLQDCKSLLLAEDEQTEDKEKKNEDKEKKNNED
ncbi:MAG: polyphosphate kinase 2 family protein [Oscillospiraceae bacterium]